MGEIAQEVESHHLSRFPEERQLLQPFLAGFGITRAQERRVYGTRLSVYFLKPETFMEEAFGFEREIMLVYSRYKDLEPRVVQAIERFMSESPAKGRVDTMIVFLISEASNPEEWARQYLLQNPESRLISGFQANALRSAKGDSWYVRRSLAGQLYQRDLFDYRLPLRSDAYFFGREDLVFDLFNAVKRSENRGLFGLRKTGKTSVLFKLCRLAESTSSARVLYYDCKYPGLRSLTWDTLLDRISLNIRSSTSMPELDSSLSAADRFLATVAAVPPRKPVALVFDEIE